MDETESWVRSIYDHHFEIADVEKISGSHDNGQIKQLVIVSVKDMIYFK